MVMPQHLKLFLKALTLLFAVAFLGKVAFALYHHTVFADLSAGDMAYALAWGFRFDLSLAAVLGLLAYLGAYLAHRLARLPFAIVLNHLTFLALVLIILLHGGDTFYYAEAGRHLGYEIKEFYNSLEGLAGDATNSHALPSLLYLLSLIPLHFLSRWWLVQPLPESTPQHRLRLFLPELQLAVVLLLSVLAVRGGLQQVPIEPLHAQEIGDSQQATLALNGPFNAVYSIANPYVARPVISKTPSPEQLELVQQLYADYRPTPLAKRASTPNVIIVFLESWSAAYMHSYGYEQVTTPFFDELKDKSLSTRGMFAGGQRTTEGLFATLCSAQNPLGQSVAQTQLQNYDYYCLPHALRDQGYYNIMVQGTKKNTSGTGAFAQLLGFKDSYGIEDYDQTPQYPPHNWGLHDPDVYALALEKLRTAPRPFLLGINTNSTHTTELPAGVEPLLPPDSHLNAKLNGLHFADRALQDFVTQLYSLSEMENTVLVLVADHVGPTSTSLLSTVAIPFLVYYPGIEPLHFPVIATQRDIAPTIFDLLALDVPRWFMGKSLLAYPHTSYFADLYAPGEIGWVDGDQLVLQPLNGSEPKECYKLASSLEHFATACDEHHALMARRGMAFSVVAQNALFQGRLAQFPAGR